MSNRWLRFVIALLAIGAAGAAGYRIYQQDQRLTAANASADVVSDATQSAVVAISELKAAMHAYVAEGQGDAFWTARAETLIDRLRTAILELDVPAAAAGISLTETLDLTDRLAAAERRARDHVRRGERLMAGEVIFTDARDLLDAMGSQIAAVRTAVVDGSRTQQAELRHEQTMLALGAAGILAFATVLLVIPGASTATAASAPVAQPVATDNADSSVRRLARERASVAPRAPEEAGPRDVAGAPAPISLPDAALVCTELGRVSQTIEISSLLERAAKVLNASGAIVWMASADRHELYPALSTGYDPRLLTRIGAIKRDANNVTAAALREAAARTSTGLGSSAAALAVPLMTPLGPVGVFSAEIRDISNIDEPRLAVATIFAAQLATLLGSMSAPAATEPAGETPAVKAQA